MIYNLWSGAQVTTWICNWQLKGGGAGIQN